jgi:tRNA-guanine family transglycosylase
LFIAGELTVLRLLTIHNLTFYVNFMAEIRKAIEEKRFATLLSEQKLIWS